MGSHKMFMGSHGKLHGGLLVPLGARIHYVVCHGHPMGPMGDHIGYPMGSHEYTMGCPRGRIGCRHGIAHGLSPWHVYGIPWDVNGFPRDAHGRPWDWARQRTPCGLPRDAHGSPWEVSWALDCHGWWAYPSLALPSGPIGSHGKDNS